MIKFALFLFQDSNVGRMHAPGKGISQSTLPYRRTVPNWLKLTSEEVNEQIFKLTKKSKLSTIYGVPNRQVCMFIYDKKESYL